jgi:hypothetical protein
MELNEIKAKCDEAVEAISTLPFSVWTQWSIYVLEAMDSKCREREGSPGWGISDTILRRVAGALRIRLSIGKW